MIWGRAARALREYVRRAPAARLDLIEPISESNGINLSKDVSDRVLVSFFKRSSEAPTCLAIHILVTNRLFSNSFAQENLYPADLDLRA